MTRNQKTQGNQMNEIRLYGPIGGNFGYTAFEIMSQIADDAKAITVRIHSPGGSVGEGLAIYNALRNHPAKITTVVDGYSASIASVIMLAGDVREVHPSSMVYVHKPWSQSAGNADDMRQAADDLDKHEQAINAIYSERTGKSVGEMQDMLRDEGFFVGQEAVDNGFADAVIDSPEAENEVAALLNFAVDIESKRTKMKTRKEIEANAALVSAENVALKADIEAKAVEVAADIEVAADAHSKAVNDITLVAESVQATLDESVALVATHVEAIEAGIKVVADFEAAAIAAANDLEDSNKLVEALKARIKDPAYQDALLEEVDAVIAPTADADADAAEKQALEDAEALPQNVLEEYEAMDSGETRIKFWNMNRNELMRLLNNRG